MDRKVVFVDIEAVDDSLALISVSSDTETKSFRSHQASEFKRFTEGKFLISFGSTNDRMWIGEWAPGCTIHLDLQVALGARWPEIGGASLDIVSQSFRCLEIKPSKSGLLTEIDDATILGCERDTRIIRELFSKLFDESEGPPELMMRCTICANSSSKRGPCSEDCSLILNLRQTKGNVNLKLSTLKKKLEWIGRMKPIVSDSDNLLLLTAEEQIINRLGL